MKPWFIAIAVSIVLAARVGHATHDPASASLPARDSRGPDGVADTASTSVSPSGGVSHSVAIVAPPGRSGMQPSLRLAYSSGGAVRGGIAVGWSLPIATIEVDPESPSSSLASRRYISNFDGTRRLLRVGDPADNRFVAELDPSFLQYRFDALTSRWTIHALDGKNYTFATHNHSTRWHLTMVEDALGNRVEYRYELLDVNGYREVALTSIEYTSNPTAGLPAHAKVELGYAPVLSCGNGVPMGAALDNHFGVKRMRGARRLTVIETKVKDTSASSWRPARRYTLEYDEAELGCSGSGLRYLERFRETAYAPDGTATAAPPLTFGYGAKQRAFPVEYTVPTAVTEGGGASGATTLLMDWDGDGWVDQLTMETGARCVLAVRPGRGMLQYGPDESVRRYPLPSAEWRDGVAPGDREGCSFSGQVALRNDELSPKVCQTQTVVVNYHFVDWDGDGRVDVLTNLFESKPALTVRDFPRAYGYTFLQDSGGGGTHCPAHSTGVESEGTLVCTCDRGYQASGDSCEACASNQYVNPASGSCENLCAEGTETETPICDNGFDTTLPPDEHTPHGCDIKTALAERANYGNRDGDFVFRVQRNLPSGLEPITAATQVVAPVPLAHNSMRVMPVDIALDPEVPSLFDINGDGYLDMVSLHPDPRLTNLIERKLGRANGQLLYVWLGHGASFSFADRTEWWLPPFTPTPQGATWNATYGNFFARDSLRFIDWNGDGLPDLVCQVEGLGIAVAFNMGSWFAPLMATGVYSPVETTRTQERPGSSEPAYLYTGARGVLSTLVDLDGDGAVELLTQNLPENRSIAYEALGLSAWGFGGGTVRSYNSVSAEWEALELRVASTAGQWRRLSNFLDVTGDGVPDAVEWITTGTPRARVRTNHASGPAPARLLATVDNGLGGTIRFSYAPTTDNNVVHLEGSYLQPGYVVRAVSREASGAPAVMTTYEYAGPKYGLDGPNDPGPVHFLGFERSISHHSGQQGWDSSRVLERRSYEQLGTDWGGHLAEQQTWARDRDGNWTPQRRAFFQYQNEGNFTHLNTTLTQICVRGTPSPALTDCVPAASSTVSEVWQSIPDVGFFLRETIAEQLGVAERSYVENYPKLLNTPSGWRLLLQGTDKGSLVGGQKKVLSRSQIEHDERGLPAKVHSYIDGQHRSTTTQTFSAAGLLIAVQSPEQGAMINGPSTVIELDDRQLYAARTWNVLKQHTDKGIDVGTGTTLWTRGPDSHRVCGTTGCSDVLEYREQRIDGFGRPLEVKQLVEAPFMPDGTLLRTLEVFTYVNTPIYTAANKLVSTDAQAGTFLRQETRVDGLGRTIARIQWHPTDAQQNEEIRFGYDAHGDLAVQQLPDPRDTKQPQWVTYSWLRDGAGRIVSHVRPDGGGSDVTYDGVTTTVVERSSLQSTTQTIYSAFGLAKQIIESQGNGDASTIFQHDALGRVTTLIDPDQVVTSFEYDMQNHRTAIVRGDRRWTVVYDRDGNATRVIKPVPAGANADDYTSITEYDVMGRPLVEKPATLGRSEKDRQRLGIGERRFVYEGQRPVAVDLPFGRLEQTYDLRGRLIRQDQRLVIPDTAVVSEQYYNVRYDDLGAPISTQFDDGTQWRVATDGFGRVRDVTWLDPNSGELVTLASYTRNRAGQALVRQSSTGQTRTWKYDELGRTTYDRIWRTATLETQVERNYGYDGDELATVWGSTLGKATEATFVYDRAHRLLAANGPGDYHAELSYTKGGNLQTALIRGAEDVPDRNVEYWYAAFDSQAVERLRSLDGGADHAVLTYDLDGNMRTRATQTGTFEYGWDGDNQIREVQGPRGSEIYLFGLRGQRLAAIGSEVKVWFAGSETHYSKEGAQLLRWQHVAANEPIARVENGREIELQYSDALQNLMLAVDAKGNPTATFLYGSFGEVARSEGARNHRRQFNGKEHDETAALRHYGFRAYDPLLLRWTSADPMLRFAPDIAGPQQNLYAFSMNNPMRYYDPDGRQVTPDAGVEAEEERERIDRMDAGAAPMCGDFRNGDEGRDCDPESREAERGEFTWWAKAGAEVGRPLARGVVFTYRVGKGFVKAPFQAVDGALQCVGDVEACAEAIKYLATHPEALVEACISSPEGFGSCLADAVLPIGKLGKAGKAADEIGAGAKLAKRTAVEVAEKVVRRGCFGAGTLVHTEAGLVPIEAIRAGQGVWTFDPATGETQLEVVLDTFATPDQPLLAVTLQGRNDAQKQTLHATGNHPFWTSRGWLEAEQLVVGDRVRLRTGEWSEVRAVEELPGRTTVYNLNVNRAHTYFVGELGAVVHNADRICTITGNLQKIAQHYKVTVKEVREAIHALKRKTKIGRGGVDGRSNPDVHIDLKTGEALVEVGDGEYGDSIGNIMDELPEKGDD